MAWLASLTLVSRFSKIPADSAFPPAGYEIDFHALRSYYHLVALVCFSADLLTSIYLRFAPNKLDVLSLCLFSLSS